jgi:hypothetical protein
MGETKTLPRVTVLAKLPSSVDPTKWQITSFEDKLIAAHPDHKPIIIDIKKGIRESGIRESGIRESDGFVSDKPGTSTLFVVWEHQKSPMQIHCNRCGKPASSPFVEIPPGEPFVLRGWVECPECIEKRPDPGEMEAALRRLHPEIKALADADWPGETEFIRQGWTVLVKMIEETLGM